MELGIVLYDNSMIGIMMSCNPCQSVFRIFCVPVLGLLCLTAPMLTDEEHGQKFWLEEGADGELWAAGWQMLLEAGCCSLPKSFQVMLMTHAKIHEAPHDQCHLRWSLHQQMSKALSLQCRPPQCHHQCRPVERRCLVGEAWAVILEEELYEKQTVVQKTLGAGVMGEVRLVSKWLFL